MNFTWNVRYWVERRWFRWHVHATYTLMYPPEGGPNYILMICFPWKHLFKSNAEIRAKVLRSLVLYGPPNLYPEQEESNERDQLR